MKAFLSWSGDKSHDAAIAFADWLPCVIQAIDPWVSSKDIDRGSIWYNEILEQLKDTNFGIVFVTRENQSKPWLLFESGALSKGLSENRICTVLLDLNVRDIKSNSPLRHLNHTTLEKQSVFALLKTINKHIDGNRIQEKHLENSFNALWDQLESRIGEILNAEPAEEEDLVEDEDVLNDILENVLSINKRLSGAIHRPSERNISKHHAERLFKKLLKLDLERDDIEEALEEFVPNRWLVNQLDEVFGEDDED